MHSVCSMLRPTVLIIIRDQTANSAGVANIPRSEHVKEHVADNGDGKKKLDVTEVRHPVQAMDTDSNSGVLKR